MEGKIKNSFMPFERVRDAASGEVYKDQDGATYLRDHSHPALQGKEFCNSQEAYQAIQDYNSDKKTADPFTGELILLNVISFS